MNKNVSLKWKRCYLKFLWLHRRLTKEELERRSKESQLSEVGGKAVEAEEQVKVLRQRINEMEDQMKKTEEVYKEQVGINVLNEQVQRKILLNPDRISFLFPLFFR